MAALPTALMASELKKNGIMAPTNNIAKTSAL
jgi:hypothetical protein